jgi:uncharacterized membrane protein
MSRSEFPGAAASPATIPEFAEPATAGDSRRPPADRIPWLIAAGVFAAYTTISVYRYLRLQPTSWDLGIFTEYVKQYAHLRAPIVDARTPGLDLLGDHFHPIVALIAPFFRLFPSPATLLVAQALLAALSVIPVSRAAAQLLGTGAGRAIGAAYGFSWGLQQMINYDFHEIAFAVPLLACSLSGLVRGRIKSAVWWALPLVFVKEDQGFTVAAIGLLLIVVYRQRIAGIALAVWGMAWSVLAIVVIIPHFNPAHVYPYWSNGGELSPAGTPTSIGGLLTQLIASPGAKLPTLALILLPTAFIALRSPLVLAALPSLVLRFVSTNSAYWGTAWHYNATVMPIVFIAAIDGVARMRASGAARHRSRPGQPVPGRARLSDRLDAGRAQPLGRLDAAVTPVPGRLDAAVTPVSGRLGAALAQLPGRFGPGLARMPGRLGGELERYGAAMMLAVCAALAFQFPLSSLWNSQTYQLGPHVAAARAAMALVPDGATVQTNIDLLGPLGARTDAFWLGNSAYWHGSSGNPATTYVVYDRQSGDLPPPPHGVLSYIESLDRGATYVLIYVNDGVYVFRRS